MQHLRMMWLVHTHYVMTVTTLFYKPLAVTSYTLMRYKASTYFCHRTQCWSSSLFIFHSFQPSPIAPDRPGQGPQLQQAHVQLYGAHSIPHNPTNHTQFPHSVSASHHRRCSAGRCAQAVHTAVPGGLSELSEQLQQAVDPTDTGHTMAELHESSHHTPTSHSPC